MSKNCFIIEELGGIFAYFSGHDYDMCMYIYLFIYPMLIPLMPNQI